MFQFVKGEVICNRKKNIRRGIFQGESLSQLLFEICVIPKICVIPLTKILRNVESGYILKDGEKLKHMLFMDDLKIFA